MPDTLTVLAILGLPYCGSTLFNLMLDSHPHIRGVGEIQSLASPETGLSALCTHCGEQCRFFSPELRRRLRPDDFYATIAGQFPTRFLADSSKNLEWYGASTRFPSGTPIRFVPMLVVKHPLRQLASYAMNVTLSGRNRITPFAMFYRCTGADRLPSGGGPNPLQTLARRLLYDKFLYWYLYRNSLRFTEEIPALFPREKAFVIKYEDIVLRPRETITPVLRHVGLEYDDSMERCYDQEHHQIGGNSGALYQVTGRDTDINLHQSKRDYYGQFRGIRMDNRYEEVFSKREMLKLSRSAYYLSLCSTYGYGPTP